MRRGCALAKRTTRITVETLTLIAWRKRGSPSAKWCAACASKTQTLTVEQAAGICSVTQRTIFRLVETDCLHFYELPAGELLICAESLRRFAEEATWGESP